MRSSTWWLSSMLSLGSVSAGNYVNIWTPLYLCLHSRSPLWPGTFNLGLSTIRNHDQQARKGNPYDNVKAESFIKTLKYEEVYLCEYQNIHEARQKIDYFINEMYNEDRHHSSLGYLPPSVFEEKFLAAGRT